MWENGISLQKKGIEEKAVYKKKGEGNSIGQKGKADESPRCEGINERAVNLNGTKIWTGVKG